MKARYAVLVFVGTFVGYLALNSWDWWLNRPAWISTAGGYLSWGVLAIVCVLVVREAKRRLKKN